MSKNDLSDKIGKLICPFCQQELDKDPDGYYTCYTDNCGCMAYGGNGASGSESLWLALIGAYNSNKNLVKENDLKHDAIVKRTKELERTRKALEIALDAIDKGESALIGCQEADDKYISDVTAEDGLELMSKAYKQIKALKQKDVK